MAEKIFNRTIQYFKISTISGVFICILSIVFNGLDPFHSLDGMLWNDLYNTSTLPDISKPVFNLFFLLFTYISIIVMILLFLITKYALSKKEKWAYFCIVLIGVFWPIGGSIITIYTKAWSYFISVGMMTVLFLPPVILLYPYIFKNNK